MNNRDEVCRLWREASAEEEASRRLRDLSRLMERVSAANSPPSQQFLAAELVRAGAARELLTVAEDSRARMIREVRETGNRYVCDVCHQALKLLAELLQGNVEACDFVGRTCFRELMPLVHMDLQSVMSSQCADVDSLFYGMCALNSIIAVSSEARSSACQNSDFLRVILRIVEMSSIKSYGFLATFADMGIQGLSHLAIPECEKAPARTLHDGAVCRCCVCLEDVKSNEMLEAAWCCRICGQVLHRTCADQWLRAWRRCPYCRAMTLPDIEVKDLLMSTKLLTFLESERASTDVPLAFSTSLLIVHIASSQGEIELFEVLYKRGFLSQLLSALEAAALGSDWPKGSNCFPLVWKLAVTIEQFAKTCYKPELEGTLRPLVRFLLTGKASEGQEVWCARAIQACLVDEGQTLLVKGLLQEEQGPSYDDLLIADQLEQTLFPQASQDAGS